LLKSASLTMVIARGAGLTPSEKYLASLADKAFLKLWSYPNLFIDRKQAAKATARSFVTCWSSAGTTS
jgi:hypothetical protein